MSNRSGGVAGALFSALLLMFASPFASAQQGDGTDVSIQTNVWKPRKVPADGARIAQLRVASGFAVNVFARNLGNTRILAVAPNGDVYVTRRDQGDILRLRDTDRDGRADGPAIWAGHRAGAHGIAIHGNKLFLITVKEVFVADIRPDGDLSAFTLLIGDLPDSGQHPNRTIAWGPDDMLWISVGSTCNACNESNPENATILRVSPDGKSRVIWARGLRNTIGFDWHPVSGELWGFDHGIDFLGDDTQPEELNHIVRAKQYGWPHVSGEGELDALDQSRRRNHQGAVAATCSDAHGAGIHRACGADAIRVLSGRLVPARVRRRRIRHDAWLVESQARVGIRGRQRAILRRAAGEHRAFRQRLPHRRRHDAFRAPVGLAVAKDGALLMADDANGVIYRIAYTGKDGEARCSKRARHGDARAGRARRWRADRDSAIRDAMRRNACASDLTTIEGVDSRAATPSTTTACRRASVGPRSKARSLTSLIMEDPDAKPITPFVHWLAWNIPGNYRHLPEGLQEQEQLTDPPGVRQGRTSRGTVGYLGPRPPVGDPPHHYHFQIFALDTVLSVAPGAERDELLSAMSGHVLAAGEVVGTYRQLVAPLK